MASPYPGQPRPPVAQNAPSPAPLAGGVPTINVPADNDGAASAELFAQQYKTLADYIAWIQSAARLNPPVAANATANAWNGPVTSGGVSSAVVAAFGALTKSYALVLKTTLGGNVGVAKIQYSLDGGATYNGVDITTAASVSLGATGITVTCNTGVGPFVNGVLYAFFPTMVPQLKFADVAGNVRHVVDHHGLEMGRVSEVRQDWLVGFSKNSNGKITDIPSWSVDINGAGTVDGVAPTTGTPWPYVVLTPGTSVADGPTLYMTQRNIGPTADLLAVLEYAVTWTGSATCLITHGFGNFGPGNTVYAQFRKANGGANWQAETRDGTTLNTTDTGVAAVAGTQFRCRIELMGANLTGGPLVRFFINEAIVAEIGTNTPFHAGAFTPLTIFLTILAGDAIPTTLAAGPVLCRVPRFKSLPEL